MHAGREGVGFRQQGMELCLGKALKVFCNVCLELLDFGTR